MQPAIYGLLGVIVGGVITMCTEYFITKQSVNLEKLKMSKEDDMNTLYNFLIPVIEIYARSDLGIETSFQYNYTILGNGLDQQYIKDLRQIVKVNKRFIPLKLINKFNRVDDMYEVDDGRYISQEVEFLERKGERPIDCYYDSDKAFIIDVKKAAEIIEEKYN